MKPKDKKPRDEEYLAIIKRQEDAESLEYRFPHEKLGIADRALINWNTEQTIWNFEKKTRRVEFTTVHEAEVDGKLEKMGFRLRKRESLGDEIEENRKYIGERK